LPSILPVLQHTKWCKCNFKVQSKVTCNFM